MEGHLEEDCFKILIASDNHLGYGEKKPILQHDSFRAFEEILQLAVKNDVDFILLGGDLFHESQPSAYCMYRCSELLKNYCLGDRPVSIEFLSDQSDHFGNLKSSVVNYEDPNINVSIPVFSIHGNHDNPTGNQLISALDVLSCNGLINYFGRWTDLSKVEIKPILLKKGRTKLALYGLSHIPDQRLARLFHDKKVKMIRVEEEGWFNILVLHQNRADRGVKNFIPYNVIPKFIHLVIWGHEHDCNIQEAQQANGVYISQPGSSVATSLAEGEAVEKKVAILKVHNDEFTIIPIPLKSVRPFIFSDIVLCNPDSDEYSLEDPKQQAINDVKSKVEEMIAKAARRQEEAGSQQLLPSIRLMVKYYVETQIFNPIRLGHEYEDRVANPADMFKLGSYVTKERQRKTNITTVEDDEFDNMEDWATRVEDVVEKYFENYGRGNEMKVLSVKLMTKAVSRYIDVSDSDAVKYAFESQVKKTVEKLIEKNPDFNNVAECLEDIKHERTRDEDREVTQLMKEFENENRAPIQFMETAEISDDDEPNVVDLTGTPARGRGSRGGRGSRAPRRPRARAGRTK